MVDFYVFVPKFSYFVIPVPKISFYLVEFQNELPLTDRLGINYVLFYIV